MFSTRVKEEAPDRIFLHADHDGRSAAAIGAGRRLYQLPSDAFLAAYDALRHSVPSDTAQSLPVRGDIEPLEAPSFGLDICVVSAKHPFAFTARSPLGRR